MAATATAARNRWVVCDDYVAGPFTEAAAVTAKARHDASASCSHEHEVVIAGRRPVALNDLRSLRANWDHPFLADPADEAAAAERREQTYDLAAGLLAAPLGARVGGMTVAAGGWSKATADAADKIAVPGSPEWTVLLGIREHVRLTADGGQAYFERWCSCAAAASMTGAVRYEYWTVAGMTSHGYVCPACRRLLQAG